MKKIFNSFLILLVICFSLSSCSNILLFSNFKTNKGNVTKFAGKCGAENDFKLFEIVTPQGITIDANNNVYISDTTNHSIKKITPDNNVIILAGTGRSGFSDGEGKYAKFFVPLGLETDSKGNIYIADQYNNRIRKITSQGNVSTIAGKERGFADGKGEKAKFSLPTDISLDNQGNIYVADRDNHRIRKITSQGNVLTVAGNGERGFANGKGEKAKFAEPSGVDVDSKGNIYVADRDNHKIRKISPDGIVSTLTGNEKGNKNGKLEEATFYEPVDLIVDIKDNIYVLDAGNQVIRKISPDGIVSTFAGNSNYGYANGKGTEARFYFDNPAYSPPFIGITISNEGIIYLTDTLNNCIRKIE